VISVVARPPLGAVGGEDRPLRDGDQRETADRFDRDRDIV